MQRDNNIEKLMQRYFGKHFSRYGCILFGRWLKADDGQIQKDEMLQKIWKESIPVVTDSTYTDWEALQKYLFINPVHKCHVPFYRQLVKYAAVIILMIVTAGMTYWVTNYYKPARQIEMVQIFVPYGENRQIKLPDGSNVWVGAGSLFVYPKDFSSTNTRTVYLMGEASFSIQKNPEKPFIVKTTYLDVQALGTIFTVDAYPNDTCTTATLEEGSVLVSVQEEMIQPTVLMPDQQFVYSHIAHEVTIKSIDASLYKMERNGYLIFENISFNRLIASLERKFNVTIHYNSQKYASEYYNVKFSPDETIEDVLNILNQLVGIQYKIKGKIVFIN